MYKYKNFIKNLGRRQPCPMIRISPPWVWMLNRESQPIVYCRHINGCVGLRLLWALWVVLGRCSLFWSTRLRVLDQPVVVAPVCVADDVVQHHQPLKLQLYWEKVNSKLMKGKFGLIERQTWKSRAVSGSSGAFSNFRKWKSASL